MARFPTLDRRSGGAEHRFPPEGHQWADSGLLSTHRRTAASPSAPSVIRQDLHAIKIQSPTHARSPVMGTLIISATAILVVMGFSNHVLWLAAIALLFLYVRYGRTGGGTSAASVAAARHRAPPREARPDPGAARTPPTARTAPAVTVRPSGSAATAANVRWRRGARSARRSNTGAPGHRPGAPQIGNQRLRSCSIRRSSASAALICSSSALSRCWPPPASGAKG